MKTKALVTGASGVVGNHVINQLIENPDIQVIASSRNTDKAKECKWFDKVKYVQFDINSEHDNPYELFDKPDILIHLAWEGLPNYNDEIHIEKNLYNNYKFIKRLVKDGLKNINCIGTCFEYGMQNGQLQESLDAKPNTSYALAKDSLRKFLEELNKNIEFDFKWIRLFYMHGSGQSEKSLLAQLDKAIEQNSDSFNMSKGEQLRDYLPIEEIAKNIVLISLQNSVNGIVNCGSGEPISIRTLVENHINKLNAKIKFNFGYYGYASYEPMAFWADIQKLNSIKNSEVNK